MASHYRETAANKQSIGFGAQREQSGKRSGADQKVR